VTKINRRCQRHRNKFFAGVVDTTEQFISGVVDTGDKQ
jgi:hypothetical protein